MQRTLRVFIVLSVVASACSDGPILDDGAPGTVSPSSSEPTIVATSAAATPDFTHDACDLFTTDEIEEWVGHRVSNPRLVNLQTSDKVLGDFAPYTCEFVWSAPGGSLTIDLLHEDQLNQATPAALEEAWGCTSLDAQDPIMISMWECNLQAGGALENEEVEILSLTRSFDAFLAWPYVLDQPVAGFAFSTDEVYVGVFIEAAEIDTLHAVNLEDFLRSAHARLVNP